METIVTKACGLDVHQANIVACIMRQGTKKQIKEFGTTTKELIKLKEWLQENKITDVAMESTGVYWKPVFNIIGDEFKILLVNARHIKNVPGRKTDVQDAEWICKLLRAGLLKGSFIPEEKIRELRNLTRHQKKLQSNISSEKNRVHKILEEANIKINSVLSDVFGVTGKLILQDIIKGISNPKTLAQHLTRDKRLTNKIKDAEEALQGRITKHHRFILKTILDHIYFLEKQVKDIDKQIEEIITAGYQKEYELLKTIPGVNDKGAKTIIAEIGTDMSVFPNEQHLSSWAGLSPGNNESAGKKKSSKMTKGNKHLKSILVECAWSSIRKKDSYLRAKYYLLVKKKGAKKAICVIAHKLLIACYAILYSKVPYKDLGASHLETKNSKKLLSYYRKKIEHLGYQANIVPLQATA